MNKKRKLTSEQFFSLLRKRNFKNALKIDKEIKAKIKLKYSRSVEIGGKMFELYSL